ncbi:MAG: flagellar export protein FliJ [Sulfuricella sp.]|nr:flagellar export protein FliJ [Sulfuricella sp.]
MARPFPLKTLLDLARDHSDEAGRKLAQLKIKWHEAEEKMHQLIAFREEYRNRLHLNTQTGIAMSAWREFQSFMLKLDKAIELQGDEVAKCKLRWEGGQREWLEQQRKLKAFDTLSQRHHAKEAVREAKVEQKEQDEFAGKSVNSRKTGET